MKTYFIIRKLDEADSDKVQSIVSYVQTRARQAGWALVADINDADLIVVVGGDGTMLHAMHCAHRCSRDVPVIGFNIGKIGFLAEFAPHEVDTAINNANLVKMDCRSVLFDTTYGHTAINEFVIAPELAKDTLKYEFFVSGVSSGSYHSNGLIISTPTGSTAYSLSVGGAIVQPSSPVFQIAPIAPMSLSSRSVIVSDKESVLVKIKLKPGAKYNLIADGQVRETVVADDIPSPFCRFHFEKHPHSVKLLHAAPWNFFTVLSQKLHWNAEL